MFENIIDLLRTDILGPIKYLKNPKMIFQVVTVSRLYKYILKRSIDLIFSSIGLILVSPLMLLIALLIKLDSKGPVFYNQVRVGINRRRGSYLAPFWGSFNRRQKFSYGAAFKIFKFRSMHVDAEIGNNPQWCQVNDPRVTRFGRFLRKTHLDELPQLLNIFRGEMSFVGPRPERPEFVSTLTKKIPQYHHRLTMTPGLTGLAQIYQRPDISISDVRRKIRFDRLYAESISLTTDMRIIFGTIPKVLGIQRRHGAYMKEKDDQRVMVGSKN